MRVLQINCVYGQGSTGKITKDIHLALQEAGIESYVCYGRGKDTKDRNVIRTTTDGASRIRKLIAMVDGMPYRSSQLTNRKLEKVIQRLKPDIVHLQCINGFFVDIYLLLKFLKENNYATVITLHAEFMYTGGCGYALNCKQWVDGCRKCGRLRSGLGVVGFDRVKQNYEAMHQAFKQFDNLVVVGVSAWISGRARQSRIMRDCRVITIHNGIETKSVFYPRDTEKVFKKYNLSRDRRIVLSVVPDIESDLKGGKMMMELADTMDRDEFQLVVVGARGLIQDKPENLIVVPYTDSEIELAEIYSVANVFVLGSKMDNYPTVCIEANSCGTPVVGFDVGGVAETIYPGMGEVVPYGDIDSLKKKIDKWSKLKSQIPEDVRNAALKRNSKERMTEDYIKLYYKAFEEKE